MESKQLILLICLVGIVGSAATIANDLANGDIAVMIAAAIGTGMFVLFLALTGELMVTNISLAIRDKKVQENDELVAAVVAKAVYVAIKEEKDKEH